MSLSEKQKRYLLIIAKYAVVVLVVYFLFKAFGTSWQELKDYNYSVNFPKLLISFVLLVIGYILFGLMWVSIIRGHGEKVSAIVGCSMYFLANIFRYVPPGKIMQGVTMIYFVKKRGVSVASALSSTAIHQIIFVISGITISILFLPASMFGDHYQLSYLRPLGLLLGIFIYPPVLNYFLGLASKIFKREIPKTKMPFIHLVYYWLFGIFIWVVYGVALAFFASSFQALTMNEFLSVIAIFPTGYVISFLAFVAPGGLGIREGIFAFFFNDIVGTPLNLAIAGFSRLWITVMEIVVVLPLLVIYLLNKKKGKDWI